MIWIYENLVFLYIKFKDLYLNVKNVFFMLKYGERELLDFSLI